MARKQGSHGFVFEDIAGDTLRMRIKKAVFKQQHERASTRNVETLPDEFSGLSEAIFVTDPEGRLVFMNGTAEAMTGTREEECRTLSLDQLINVRLRPEDATREEIIKPCVVEGNSVTSAAQSYSLSLTSGKEIHGEFSLSPIKSSASKLV